MIVPAMAQGDVEVTDSTSGDWTGGQQGAVVVNHPPVVVTAKSYTRFYGDVNPAFGFTSEGATLAGTPEVTCDAVAASPVGTYPIIISKGGVANHNDTYVNGTLTITKAPLTVRVGTYTKKQGEAMPAFTVTYEGFKNGETEAVLTKQPTVVCEATESSAPGEYSVVVSGAEAQNYEISCVSGTLTVQPADPVTVTAGSYTRVYGDENPLFGFTSEGAPLDGQPEVVCEATSASPVGTYPIIISKGGVANYNDTYVNGTLTITKAPLTVRVENVTREQNMDNPEFVLSFTGWKLDEDESVLTKRPTATTSATKDSPVGEYEIVLSGGEAQNYDLTYENGILTVVVPAGISEILTSHPVDIYTLQGRRIRTKATTLEGLPAGIYLINGKKIVVK
jgi:hypothetical protein